MRLVSLRAIFLAASLLGRAAAQDSAGDWPVYGHDPGGQRFSPLAIVNRDNVKSLKIAWTYRTGDAYQPKNSRPTAFEATPLFIGATLYLSTPLGRVIALDPVTGKQRWSYDPIIDRDKGYGDFANRGVSAWKSPKGQLRIFVATIDARLIAVDAATGMPCKDFGDNGVVNLRTGLRIPPKGFADYQETSPPTVVGNTIVVGSGIQDNAMTDEPSGAVRGFDAAATRPSRRRTRRQSRPDTAATTALALEETARSGLLNFTGLDPAVLSKTQTLGEMSFLNPRNTGARTDGARRHTLHLGPGFSNLI